MELTDLYNEIGCIANTERARDVELMRQILSQPACKPEDNCFLAEAGGLPVGFTMVTPELAIGRTVASGGVVRSHRNRGTGRALLDAAIVRAKSLRASVLHVQVPSADEIGRHLLSTAGFWVVRTYSTLGWEGREVPTTELPRGFGIRGFRPGRDEGALTELQNAAFAGSWGFCPNTVEEIVARLSPQDL